MNDAKVHVVRTGTANLASVLAALKRAGADPEVTHDASQLAKASRVVLPGVGAFAAAIDTLREHGLEDPLRARIEAGRPTLAICLGLQLFAETSEESPGARGLGIIAGGATKFPPTVRVPQLGWNTIEPEPGIGCLVSGHAYFANSYRLIDAPKGWRTAWSDHGGKLVAAFERGAVLACQFHPELSGAWGAALINRWLRGETC